MPDTIFALATPPGRSGVAVIRISGPHAVGAASALGAGGVPLRTATLRRLRRPADRGPLDDALVLRFEGPKSYTGEDLIELQVHGGPSVCRSVVGALGALPGLRHAEAGEFTRRALMNGKLDLAQVEGVGDLLAAETEAQARQALALMDGGMSAAVARWRDGLINALALINAVVDFADDDVPDAALDEAGDLLHGVEDLLETELAGSHVSERLRLGFEVALVGAPNVGKSTLLNAMVRRDAALTSAIAGTTRDAIEVRMDLSGLPVTIVDMAGLRETTDALEVMGVSRARLRAEAADLRVFLLEPGDSPTTLGVPAQRGDLAVRAKADLDDVSDGPSVSGLTGLGLPALLAEVAETLGARVASPALVNRERHRGAVERALRCVRTARGQLAVGGGAELAAEEVGVALRALDFLVGRIGVEEVLDAVFRNFCLGK